MKVAFNLGGAIQNDTGPNIYRRNLFRALYELSNSEFSVTGIQYGKDDLDETYPVNDRYEELEIPQPPLLSKLFRTTTKKKIHFGRGTNFLTENKISREKQVDINHIQGLPHRRLFWVAGRDLTTISTIHAPWIIVNDMPDEVSEYTVCQKLKERSLYRILTSHLDGIITVSKYMKKRLAEEIGYPRERIYVTYNAPPLSFKPTTDKRLVNSYGIPTKYILHLSNASKRKNPQGVVNGFVEAKKTYNLGDELVLAGGRWKKEDFDFSTVPDRIIDDIKFVGFIPREDLPAIYSHARTFLMPSYVESCSLAQLEAMACGTPVVATNRTGMPEIGGESCLYVDRPSDYESIGHKINQAIERSDELGKQALKKSREYTWKKTAVQTKKVYSEVLENQI